VIESAGWAAAAIEVADASLAAAEPLVTHRLPIELLASTHRVDQRDEILAQLPG
jgi:hypothetical protein